MRRPSQIILGADVLYESRGPFSYPSLRGLFSGWEGCFPSEKTRDLQHLLALEEHTASNSKNSASHDQIDSCFLGQVYMELHVAFPLLGIHC